MRRIKVILAVVALVIAMMVFAAPAMADMEMSSSGGNSVGSFGGGGGDVDFSSDGGTGGSLVGGTGGDIDFGDDGDIELG
jgi:uncharacterized membrane protein